MRKAHAIAQRLTVGVEELKITHTRGSTDRRYAIEITRACVGRFEESERLGNAKNKRH